MRARPFSAAMRSASDTSLLPNPRCCHSPSSSPMDAGWPNTFSSLMVAAGLESSLRRTYPTMESSHTNEMKCSVPPFAS